MTATPPNTGSLPEGAGERSEHRAEERAGDGGGERRPDVLAAALARGGADQPPERAGPRRGAADALDEPRDVEHHDVLAERERQARGHQQPEAEQHRLPNTHPGGQPPAGQCADERTRRIGRRQDARGGLREPVPVGQLGQDRRDSRIKQRVDEDDDAGEGEQSAHGPMLVGALGLTAG